MHTKTVLTGLLLIFLAPGLLAQTLPAPWTHLKQVSERQLAPGIRYSKRVAATDARFAAFRVAAGAWGSRNEALAALGTLGFPPLPLVIQEFDGRFRIITGPLATEELANLVQAHLRYQGLAGGATLYDGLESPDAVGPQCVHVLELAPGAAELRPVRAMDEGVGLETIGSLARRMGALAGVNAGYFRTGGTYRGESDGIYKWNGNWFSEQRVVRSVLGWNEQAAPAGLLIGRLQLEVSLSIAGQKEPLALQGINRPRDRNEAILYTPQFHRTTLTDPGGLEIELRQGKVSAVFDPRGSSPIPSDGLVISASGQAAERLRPHIRKGLAVEPRFKAVAAEASQQALWERCLNIVGGGPRLLSGGRAGWDQEPEKNNPGFFFRRHPRTAVGYRQDGTVLLVVVDGRQWRDSLGLSIPQLAELMLGLGCVEALNLDGGGSSAMVVGNETVNHPSDAGGERADSDALLIFPRPKK